MKIRIISGLVGTVILLAVLLCPWTWVFTLAAAAAAAIAVYELLHNTGIVKNAPLLVGSMSFAAAEIVVGVHAVTWANALWVSRTVPFFLVTLLKTLPLALFPIYLLFALCLFAWHRQSFVWKGFGLTVYATAGFLSLAVLRNSSVFGLVYVLLPLIIAWMSDTGAYFVGSFFGKHKMAPVISPKKTWEGFFGGWVISVALTALFAVICNACIPWHSSLRISVGLFAVLAAVLAPLSVVGDLLASLIKRRRGIKDYGHIMPGHGGVMDRFDSVVFIAPLVVVALMLFG
ncbi:MAG: phosphatidate cytidylyltransferase [Clostridia bacterium]|nr:phosphatidate cytidylyltransferase [Clostridia bacterium]